jgi:hypothetical protein
MQPIAHELPLARRAVLVATFVCGCIAFGMDAIAAGPEPDDTLIREALSAAPPAVASTAKVMTMDGKILKEGSGPYTCFPTSADVVAKGGRQPMCLDKVWLAWADALMHKKPFKADGAGIGYMLAGDAGASNVDPYAQGPTADNQWVVEGPHIMVIVPDPAQLDGFPIDPNSGGAYVMWKGTPYAHVMVPLAARPRAK